LNFHNLKSLNVSTRIKKQVSCDFSDQQLRSHESKLIISVLELSHTRDHLVLTLVLIVKKNVT